MSQHQSEAPAQRLEIPVYHETGEATPVAASTMISARKMAVAKPTTKSRSSLQSVGRAIRNPTLIAAVIIGLLLVLVVTAHASGNPTRPNVDCQTWSDARVVPHQFGRLSSIHWFIPVSEELNACRIIVPPKQSVTEKVVPSSSSTAFTQTSFSQAGKLIILLITLVGAYFVGRHRGLQPVRSCNYQKVPLTEPPAPVTAVSDSVGESGAYDALCGWVPATELIKQVAAIHPTVQPMNEAQASAVSRLGARSENQDYGLICGLGEGKTKRTLLVCADGLGGHVGGRPASFVAARAVLIAAASHADLDTANLMPVLLREAEHAVASFAKEHFEADQCMTTCIVAIADNWYYYTAWLGDGGIQLRRINGSWISLMEPQRSPEASNIVTGLLGTCRVNEWRYAIERRFFGDWLIIGSDGAMDRIEDWEKFSDTPRIRMLDGASLHRVLDDWWALAEREMPETFDDNITAVTLVTPQARPAAKPAPALAGWVSGNYIAKLLNNT